jgi:hypothetical protein
MLMFYVQGVTQQNVLNPPTKRAAAPESMRTVYVRYVFNLTIRLVRTLTR